MIRAVIDTAITPHYQPVITTSRLSLPVRLQLNFTVFTNLWFRCHEIHFRIRDRIPLTISYGSTAFIAFLFGEGHKGIKN